MTLLNVVDFNNKKDERQAYLKVLMKFGFELTIADDYSTLKKLREKIMWSITNKEDFYHIKCSSLDSIINLETIVAMDLSYEGD